MEFSKLANIKRIYFFYLLMQCLLLSQIANSQVYKLVDEDGKISYSDKKMEAGEAINLKKIPRQASDKVQQLNKQKKLLKIMQQERREKSALKLRQQEEKVKQKQRCAMVRKRLKELKDAALLFEKTDDPNNPRFLSNAERAAEEKKNQHYLNDKC